LKRVLLFFILLALATCFSQEVRAQTVILTVIDSVTGLKLPDARVLCNPSPVSLIVNSDSVFKIHLSANSEIRISHLGYKTQVIQTDLYSSQFRILLKPEDIPLSFVQVTGERSVDQVLSLLPAEKLAEGNYFAGERDPLRLVSVSPAFNTANEGQGMLFFRGNFPYQSSIYLNGLPVPNPWHAGGFISAIQGDLLESVETYGSSHPGWSLPVSGAVISMNTPQYQPNKWAFSTGAGLISSQFSVSGPVTDNGYIRAGFRRTYVDLIVKGLFSGSDQPLPLYHFDDFLISGGYNPENGWKLSFTSLFFIDNLSWKNGSGGNSASKLITDKFEWNYTGFEVTGSRQINARLALKNKLFFYNETLNGKNTQKYDFSRSEGNAAGLNSELGLISDSGLQLVTGVSVILNKRNAIPFFLIGSALDSKTTQGFVYFKMGNQLLPGLTGNGGLKFHLVRSDSPMKVMGSNNDEDFSSLIWSYTGYNLQKEKKPALLTGWSGDYTLSVNSLDPIILSLTLSRKIQFEYNLNMSNVMTPGLFLFEPATGNDQILVVHGIEFAFSGAVNDVSKVKGSLFFEFSENVYYAGQRIYIIASVEKGNVNYKEGYEREYENFIPGGFSDSKRVGLELEYEKSGEIAGYKTNLRILKSLQRVPVYWGKSINERVYSWENSPDAANIQAGFFMYWSPILKWKFSADCFWDSGSWFSQIEKISTDNIILSWDNKFPYRFRVDLGLTRKFESESGNFNGEFIFQIYNVLSRANPSIIYNYLENNSYSFFSDKMTIKRKQYSMIPIIPTLGFRLWF